MLVSRPGNCIPPIKAAPPSSEDSGARTALTLAVFALGQAGLGTWLPYGYVTHPAPSARLKLSGLALYLISLVLLGRIVTTVYALVNSRRTSRDATRAAEAKVE